MIIAIDLTPLSYRITGVERFALCVSEQMLKLDNENQYILVFRNSIYDGLERFVDNNRVKAVILHGNNRVWFWYVTRLAAYSKIKADRYLFFAFSSPLLFYRKGIFNTIHDLGSWDVPWTMKFRQRFLSHIERRLTTSISQGIITVSEFSKGRINSILKYPKDKIRVIPSGLSNSLINAPDIPFSEVQIRTHIASRYIMALSTIEPKKNLDLLLSVYDEIADKVDYDLVLVGRVGWKTDNYLSKYTNMKRIHLTGFVEDSVAKCIYKNAICFVFPSIYEGFGLPPVEALAMGTPVIASNAASIPEVLMEQAEYFESNNRDELKTKLLNLTNTVMSMKRTLSDYQRVEYNFETSAKKVLDFIQN